MKENRKEKYSSPHMAIHVLTMRRNILAASGGNENFEEEQGSWNTVSVDGGTEY